MPGEAFGRYIIEDLLGEGGMGRVYRALDTKLGRKVALKIILPADTDSHEAERAARFLREARAGAALDHPHAVAIFDVGEVGGVSFIAMELIAGHPLRHYIALDSIGWQQHIRWLVEIAGALEAAHREGLIHRDIKPDNVMIRSDGRVKVLDFGIARRMASAPAPAAATETPSITLEGGVLGTPLYMAPEQLHGEPLDGRVDQFSWGVVAYELLTGKPPWSGETITIISQILTKDPAPLRTVKPELPAPVEAVVLRALAKAPKDRFGAMSEIIAALVPFAASQVEVDLLLPASGASRARAADRPPHDATPPRTVPAALERTTAISPHSRRRKILVAAAAISLAVGVGVAAARMRSAALTPVPSPQPSTPVSAPKHYAITDLPIPATVKPEAAAAYREALQGFRDAAWEKVAHPALQRAVELDPSFGIAYLRLALTLLIDANNRIAQREAFQKAISLRASLAERDQALLEALQPLFQHEPPDPLEAVKRLEAASVRYPGDAEFLNLILLLHVRASPEELLPLAERCLAIDPLYADCWQGKATLLARLGRTPEAIKTFERCLEVSPAANDCVKDRALVMQTTGQCSRFEQDARTRIANDQKSPAGYRDLAMALYKLGRPLGAVREALEQSRMRMPDAQRARATLVDEWVLAVLAGRLADAEKTALEYSRLIADSPVEAEHMAITRTLVELYRETGRYEDAARVAGEFLSRRDAWIKPLLPTVWSDSTLFLLHTKRQTGEISRDDYVAHRSAWLGTWESSTPEQMRSAPWIVAYASAATTAEDAKEALQNAPQLMPSIYYWSPTSYSDALIGKLYSLAGRADEAIPYLTRATADCTVLFNPFRHTAAHYHLGVALQQKGDSAGACASYQVVLDRWGNAKPRSLTAEKARAQTKALGCKP